jgi:hypothetical protein
MKATILIMVMVLMTSQAFAHSEHAFKHPHKHFGDWKFWQRVDNELQDINRQVNRGVRHGHLIRWEIRRIDQMTRRTIRNLDHYRHRPLNRWQKGQIFNDLNALAVKVNAYQNNEWNAYKPQRRGPDKSWGNVSSRDQRTNYHKY